MKVYKPKPERAWNPLKKFRNMKCPCGSQKKSKSCHGVQETLLKSDVDKVNQYLLSSTSHPISFDLNDPGDDE